MNDLQSSNLILDRKIRGHLPVTRFAVSGAGSVTVAVPDQDQPRLYHLGRLSHTGVWEETTAFSVEKLTSWDLSSSGDSLVAATNNDLYVFHGGQKKRLLTDRRDTYVGASLTSAGDTLAVASADMLMSAYSVTLVSTDGKVLWTKDLPVTLICVQISPDGSLIAVGSEEGMVYLLDYDHRIAWQFDAGEPVVTVCVPSCDGRVVVGGTSGMVAAIRDAEKLWEAGGHGPVTACAGTSNGKVTVVARDGGDDGHTVECHADDGKVFLAYSAPSAVASIACSDDGRYLAISCRDGSLQVIEMQGSPSRIADARQAASLYASAVAQAGRGDYGETVPALVRVLELDPANVDASTKLAETAHLVVHESLRQAEESMVNGGYAEAADRLLCAWENCVYAPDLTSEVLSARRTAADRMLDRARELFEKGVVEDALDVVHVLLRLDFTNAGARELLGWLEQEITDRLVRQADDALASDQPAEAVRLLEQAFDRSQSDVIREKLTRARCEEALAEGLALYHAQKFSQAVFQFRKVLSIDPQNAEALKHIEYAEKLSEDDTLFDRFSRLE